MRMEDTPRRRPYNVTLDPLLVAEARALGVPLSATLEEALRVRTAEARAKKWRADNAAAIVDYNERIAQDGVFSDGLRRF